MLTAIHSCEYIIKLVYIYVSFIRMDLVYYTDDEDECVAHYNEQVQEYQVPTMVKSGTKKKEQHYRARRRIRALFKQRTQEGALCLSASIC